MNGLGMLFWILTYGMICFYLGIHSEKRLNRRNKKENDRT